MYRNCEEMPEIGRMLRDGAPNGGKGPRCEECGAVLEPGERAFSWAGVRGREVLVCEVCFRGLFDELSIDEKAALAGSEAVVIGKGAEYYGN